MDDDLRDFEDLMTRVQAGSQDAAQEVFARYGDAVRRVVRHNLHQRLRRHYDSADFEQSVWGSFFQIPAERYSFPTPDDLVAFLSRVAYNKVMARTRQRLGGTRRHDMRDEVSLDEPHGPNDGATLAGSLPAPTHTPSKYVMADERWLKLTRNLPPGHVRILELMLEGYSDTEIAERLGHDRKVIQRLLERLKDIAFPS